MYLLHIARILPHSLVQIVLAAPYCPIPGIPCPTSETLPVYMTRITTGIQTALLGLLTGMFIFYTVKLAMSSSDESHVTEARNAYLHAMFGAILIAGAAYIASSVPANTVGINNAPLIDPTSGLLPRLIKFFTLMVASALVIAIGYYGARLITAQDEGAGSSARQGIVRAIGGLAAVMLVGVVIGAFETRNTTVLGAEASGIGNFLITIFGVLAVVAIVVAGFLLVISANEELKDRAKKIIIATSVAVIVVMASAAIIGVFF